MNIKTLKPVLDEQMEKTRYRVWQLNISREKLSVDGHAAKLLKSLKKFKKKFKAKFKEIINNHMGWETNFLIQMYWDLIL